jgi:hypothetical protein
MSLSFEHDVKGLFRQRDIQAMINARGFDLSSYKDVEPRADRILKRLEAGEMPCDGAWPSEQIAKFRQWIADGKLP